MRLSGTCNILGSAALLAKNGRKFVKGLVGKRKADDKATPNNTTTKTKTRQYVGVTTVRSKELDSTANCCLADYLFAEKQLIVAHLSLSLSLSLHLRLSRKNS